MLFDCVALSMCFAEVAWLLPNAHFLLPKTNVRAIKYRVSKKREGERERFLLSVFAETTDGADGGGREEPSHQ